MNPEGVKRWVMGEMSGGRLDVGYISVFMEKIERRRSIDCFAYVWFKLGGG